MPGCIGAHAGALIRQNKAQKTDGGNEGMQEDCVETMRYVILAGGWLRCPGMMVSVSAMARTVRSDGPEPGC